MNAFFFLLLAFAPAILMIGLLACRRRLSALSALPALSALLYALPYEAVLIAARFWQVSAAHASGISILGVPLERLALDTAALLSAGLVAQCLWQANYSKS
jgi:hypothetical protein